MTIARRVYLRGSPNCRLQGALARLLALRNLDHRVIDGAMAARYLQTLKGMIEEPMRLLV